MPVRITKTTEAEQTLKTILQPGFNPWGEEGVGVRERIASCPDPDWKDVLVRVFLAVENGHRMAEAVDNIRAALERKETHYLIIANDVEDHYKLLKDAVAAFDKVSQLLFDVSTESDELQDLVGEVAQLMSVLRMRWRKLHEDDCATEKY